MRQHIILKLVRKPAFESPGFDEVVNIKMSGIEFSNGQGDAVQTAWRNDGGDAAPIREPRVENGFCLGDIVTEFAFKSEPLDRFKIIHIAAHGISSVKFPDRAALVLGQDLEKRDDGLLQVREIRNLSLNADLVTLSACDTGVGRLRGEEGISNLERVFLYAGAKSVLASLWTVSDIYSQTLMQHFYSHIAEIEDKGAALRHAKLDLIREFGDRALPFYWAGFVIVGDGSKSIPISRSVPPKAPVP